MSKEGEVAVEEAKRAFQEFMLGTKSNREVEETIRTPSPSKTTSSQQVLQKTIRKYHQVIKAFEGALARDWLEVDDNLAQVMQSIANLRHRCWHASRLLSSQEEEEDDDDEMKPWQGQGYRKAERKASYLNRDDLELALSHDLLQHERMMAGARRLLLSLQQAQEALGRRLEELLLFHMEASTIIEETDSSLLNKVDECQHLYCTTASELYRKQAMAEQVLKSANDSLLYQETKGEYEESPSPLLIAQRCADKWPRTHKESNLLDHVVLLRKLAPI